MLIKNVRVVPYKRALVRPWQTAQGALMVRRGWEVIVENDDGFTGWGEAAPLPEAGTETFESCKRALMCLADKLNARSVQQALADIKTVALAGPAARCAFETALIDLLAQDHGVSSARWLNDPPGQDVEVNAAAGMLSNLSPAGLSSLHAEGYRVIKVKVGVKPVEAELIHLLHLSEGLPSDVRWRLDANGAWTLDQASVFLENAQDLPIESMEEPLARPNARDWENLQERVPFALAQDESFHQVDLGGTVRRVVIKPMAVGGPLSAYRLGRSLQDREVETIVTTTIDGPVGTRAALTTAQALDPQQRWAHGLDTGGWFVDQTGFAEITSSFKR